MSQSPPTITRTMLLEGFRELGLTPGGLAMVHSSLSAFGWVEGGAETVIEALLEALGPEGTLVLPALCQQDQNRRDQTWDITRSPSDVGKITEVFRTWNQRSTADGVPPRPSGPPLPEGRGDGPLPDRRGHVLRSDHFTHSVCALGPLAEEIVSGHKTAYGRTSPWGQRAFGHGSPWEKLYEHNALYCFLGVTFRVHTMRHFIQSVLLEETLERLPEEPRAKLDILAADWHKPGIFPWWQGEQEEEALAARGLIRYVQIGNATCRSIPTRTAVDTIGQLVREQPREWLNPEFLPYYLQAQA